MSGFLKFLSNNNAVPVSISIMMLGGTGAFAATNPDALYSATETVIAEDNTYLVNKDLSSYSPQAQIIGVTEDDEAYYVAYRFTTIALVDHVWEDSVTDKSLTVSKQQLAGGDLGEYATKQIHEVVEYELSRLRATKDIESKNVSQKIVATEYGGLIGKLLDGKTETLPVYMPVVTPPSDTGTAPLSGAPSDQTSPPATQGEAVSTAASGALKLQIMGKNPARIPMRSVFADLGVFVSDPPTNDIADLHVYLDGTEVQQVQLDTSVPGTHVIRYAATDALGNSAEVSRVVEIYDPNPAPVIPPLASTSAATTTP